MSNVPGYRRGVPVWQLVALILVILASGIISYVFYDERVRKEDELKRAEDELAKTRDALKNRTEEVQQILDALGVASRTQIDMLLGDFKPENLEAFVKSFQEQRRALIDQLGIALTQEIDDGTGRKTNKFLAAYVQPAVDAGEVPAELQGKKVGDFIAELLRHKKAIELRDKHVAEGEEAVAALNKQIVDKRDETRQTLLDWTQKENDAWAEREKSRDKLRFEPLEWAAEQEVLNEQLALEQAINNKLDARIKLQNDMATPIDGQVVAYDWRTRRGTVNLGARDRVKAGYEFDVYSMRPGPDRADKRLYHGRVRLIDVYPESSLFAVITPLDREQTIVKGDYVSSQLYDDTRHKVFVVKGWFPPDGEFTKEAVIAIIRRDGGVVQDEIALHTDYVVLGDMGGVKFVEPVPGAPAKPAAEELAPLSAEAQEKVKEGFEAYQKARHLYVTVLTLDKFKNYIERQGTQASR